jgi:hypothetical protein
MKNPFNPEFSVGNSRLRLSLTDICHSLALTAYHQSGGQRPMYYEAYYRAMRQLDPGNPALQAGECGSMWGQDNCEISSARQHHA